jgi:subtilisin family serine protease
MTMGTGLTWRGTIGAVGNNALGVVGVTWNVRLMACKFLDAFGFGTLEGALACLEYVQIMKDRGVNIIATNNSWGGGGFSQALFDAIAVHLSRGILFIAAAGNGSADHDQDPQFFAPSGVLSAQYYRRGRYQIDMTRSRGSPITAGELSILVPQARRS